MDPGIIAIIVCWIGVTVAIFGHVYRQLVALRSDMEKIAGANISEIWVKVNQMDKSIAADRELAAQFRERIAGMMLTREDFDRQITRLIAEIDRRMTTAIRHRPPVEE